MSKQQSVSELLGQSRAVITNHHCSGKIVDMKWASAIGQQLLFDGGTELRVDDVSLNRQLKEAGGEISGEDNPLIMLKIMDEYYPPISVVVGFQDLVRYTTPVPEKSSKRYGITPKPCDHKKMTPGCLYCFRKWWRAAAAARELLK